MSCHSSFGADPYSQTMWETRGGGGGGGGIFFTRHVNGEYQYRMGETEWNSVTKVPSFKAGEDSSEKVKINDSLIFTLCLLHWISAEFRPSWLSGLHLDQVTFKRKVCGEQCIRHLLVSGWIWFRLVEDVWTLASSSLTASAAVHTTTTRKLPPKTA